MIAPLRTRRLRVVAPANPRPSAGVDLEPLLAATRIINAIIVKSLAAVDEELSVPQLRVMVTLRDGGQSNLSEVAASLGVNPSNASRTCDQLVKRRLVLRKEDPHDRRRLSLSLSASGRRLLQRVMSRRRELLESIVAPMPLAEQRRLIAAMESFNAAAAALPGPDELASSESRKLLRPGLA